MIRSIYSIFIFCILCSCNQTTQKNNTGTVVQAPTADTIFRPLTETEKKKYHDAIADYYTTHFDRGFNGSLLVAKNGEILFEAYKGTYNFTTGEPITDHTPFHLASISKTFTAMTVLKLWEQGKISLDDSLQKFFPALPYKGITVKMLLNHRSGLPNYLYFMDSIWSKRQKATNEDVLNFMIVHKPRADAMPNRSYHYCNTNYLLLALIIEQTTRQSFPTYMKDSIFNPLGLKDSYVFSIKDTASYNPTYSVTRPFPMDHLDCTYGDKNVYSTVKDLYLWDKVLYTNNFLKQSTIQMAFLPYSNEKRSMHNYGLGWHLFFNKSDSIIYHNGKWHGSNTAFTRFIQDSATIIMLGNKLNNNIYRSREMGSVFTGKEDDNQLEE